MKHKGVPIEENNFPPLTKRNFLRLLTDKKYRLQVVMQLVKKERRYLEDVGRIMNKSSWSIYMEIKKHNLSYEKYSEFSKEDVENALRQAEAKIGRRYGTAQEVQKILGLKKKQSVTYWKNKYGIKCR